MSWNLPQWGAKSGVYPDRPGQNSATWAFSERNWGEFQPFVARSRSPNTRSRAGSSSLSIKTILRGSVMVSTWDSWSQVRSSNLLCASILTFFDQSSNGEDTWVWVKWCRFESCLVSWFLALCGQIRCDGAYLRYYWVGHRKRLLTMKKSLLASGLDVAMVAAEYKFLDRLLDILKKSLYCLCIFIL